MDQRRNEAPMTADQDQKTDPVIGAMIRCYIAQPKVAWPYLVMLFGAMAFLVAALFAPL